MVTQVTEMGAQLEAHFQWTVLAQLVDLSRPTFAADLAVCELIEKGAACGCIGELGAVCQTQLSGSASFLKDVSPRQRTHKSNYVGELLPHRSTAATQAIAN